MGLNVKGVKMAIKDEEIKQELDQILERLTIIESKMIDETVLNDSTRDKIVNALNAAIDVPIFSEKTERKIIDATIGTVYDVIRKVILKEK